MIVKQKKTVSLLKTNLSKIWFLKSLFNVVKKNLSARFNWVGRIRGNIDIFLSFGLTYTLSSISIGRTLFFCLVSLNPYVYILCHLNTSARETVLWDSIYFNFLWVTDSVIPSSLHNFITFRCTASNVDTNISLQPKISNRRKNTS